MRTILRMIGNSKGLILPASFIATCGMVHEVDISLKGNSIVISPIHSLRRGWYENYCQENDLESSDWESFSTEEGADEWVW